MNSGEDFRKVKEYVVRNFGYDEATSYSFAICDSMISHLVEGELDDVLPSSVFYSMSSDKKKEVLSLAHRYQGLCFYDGDSDNWLDSVEEISKIGDEGAAFRIFQNFDFLIQLAVDGGENLLKQLSEFQNYDGYMDSSVIEFLRVTFGDDLLLRQTLKSMTSPDSMYSIFTDSQKADLLTYPEGTVYFYGEDGPKLTHPLLLSCEIYNRMHSEPFSVSSQDEVSKIASELESYFHKDLDFSEVIREMSDDYHEVIRKISNRPAKDIMELQHDIHGDIPSTGWMIENNPLVQMLDTPYHPTSSKNDKIRSK